MGHDPRIEMNTCNITFLIVFSILLDQHANIGHNTILNGKETIDLTLE